MSDEAPQEVKIEIPKPVIVAVGVPSGDMVHTAFALSLAALMYAGRNNTKFALVNGKSSIVTTSRNIVVSEAQRIGADYLLFLDSDMTFPYATLRRLMDHNKDIVGATYCRRAGNHETHGVPLDETLKGTDVKGGLLEMQKMPTGVLLIKMDVFKKLTKPYFRILYTDPTEEYPDGLTYGEDYNFSDMARAAGYQLWCDVDLSHEVGHIGQETYMVARAAA